MYLHEPGISGFGDTPTIESLIDRFRFVVIEIVPSERDGRVVTTVNWKGAMSQADREKFIKRFLAPMRRHALSRGLLAKINADTHTVNLAWGNGKFGLTGTV